MNKTTVIAIISAVVFAGTLGVAYLFVSGPSSNLTTQSEENLKAAVAGSSEARVKVPNGPSLTFRGKEFSLISQNGETANWQFVPKDADPNTPMEFITVIPAPNAEVTSEALQAFANSMAQLVTNNNGSVVQTGVFGHGAGQYFVAVIHDASREQAEVDFVKILPTEGGIVADVYSRKFSSAGESASAVDQYLAAEQDVTIQNLIHTTFPTPTELRN